jgi:lysophospholipase L1-like esterase
MTTDTPPFLVLRDGLANARIRFERERAGRVVFLGGSITASPGWRDLVCASLRERFPDARFDFVNAGIPSLGSTPGAFRLERDVFRRDPVDLLFVDAAVNDQINGFTDIEQVRAMEGIARRARTINSNLDIVVLYFVDPATVAMYGAGKTPPAVFNHERVAAHYGLPSIDMARELARGAAAGEFTWAQFGGVHPHAFGHELYAKGIGRLFDTTWSGSLTAEARVTPHVLPAEPLDTRSYFRAQLVPVKEATPGDGWRLDPAWKPTDGIATRGGFVGVPTLVSEQPGATLTLAFEGTTVGIFVASGPDAGIAEYSIDGGPWRSRDLYTYWSHALHLPWAVVLDGDLPDGRHVLSLRPAAGHNPKGLGTAIRIVHFLVN